MFKPIFTKLFFCWAVLIFFSNNIKATELTYGDAVTGNIITLGDIHSYTFQGTAGDVILIRMRGISGAVNACLELIDPLGTIIAGDCDDGGLVKIEAFTLPVNGIYTINSSDYNHNDTGEYGLGIEILNNPEYTEIADCGTYIETSLDHKAEMKAFGFEAVEGDRVRIQMRSATGSLEAELTLYGPSGEKIVAGERTNSLNTIDDIILPTSGLYTFIAQDENGNDTGGIGLSFNIVSNAYCGDRLQCGDQTTTLNGVAAMVPYYLKASTGDHIKIFASDDAGKIEPVIRLYNTQGNLMETTTGASGMAFIEVTAIPEDGAYPVIFSDDKGNDVGDLHIQVQFLNRNSCHEYISCNNQSMTANLEFANDINHYGIECEAGDILIIQMRGVVNTIEPQLSLTHPDGTTLESIYSNGSLTRIDQHFISESGEFHLYASDKGGNDIGDYGLSIQSVTNPQCARNLTCDQEFVYGQLDHFAEMDAYTFEAEAGQILSVEMEEVDVLLEPQIELYSPSGLQLSQQSASYHSDITNFILPHSGTYVLLAMDKNGNDTGAYTIDFNLTHENGQSTCVSCYDGVLNGDEEGVDCGGAFCEPCCASVGTNCITCPDDLVIKCSELVDPTGLLYSTINEDFPIVKDWLESAFGIQDCGSVLIDHSFNASLFVAVCGSGIDISQPVEFKGIDACGNISYCSASIKLIDDITSYCPDVGTPCDDGNDSTINDIEDGQCNCAGEQENNTNDCPTLNFNDYSINSYGSGNQDKGEAEVLEDGTVLYIYNNAWKSIPFDYTITPETVIEFDFKSTIQGEVHGIGFDDNQQHKKEEVFNLYGTSNWGINDYTDYPGDGEYKHYVIPVGQFMSGSVDRMTFVADHDGRPKNGNSFFRNIKVYEGSCGEEPGTSCGTGSISRDIWTGIAGYPLSTIPWNTMPDHSDEVDVFEIPIDVMEEYGTRLRGYICPPQTGNYTFWIASDDFGELWLSTDDDRTHINLIAEVPGWTYPRVWDKYPEQQSVDIYLEKGQRYYVEAFMKEHHGLDNLSVGWQLPDGTLERPIVGVHLSPWDGPMTNSINNENEIIGLTQLNTKEESGNIFSNLNLKVFPNPAKDILHLIAPDLIGQPVKIQLSNQLGQVVIEKEWALLEQSRISIDLKLSRLGSGYYNLIIHIGDEVKIKPIVIME